MDDKNIIAEAENGEIVEFKTAFKGYSIPEVNEYIAAQQTEAEEIKAENAELYRKIEALTAELNRIRIFETERNSLLEDAKAEADRIVKEAKKQAAQELLRANRQRSRLVADMVAQVDEQKRLYLATKIEAAKFRADLFAHYKDHIELINAMSEGAGAFDEEGTKISDEDFEKMEKLLEADKPIEKAEDSQYEAVDQSAFEPTEGQALLIEAFSDTASITIPPSTKILAKKQEKTDAKNSKKNAKAAKKETEAPKDQIKTRNEAIFGDVAMFTEFKASDDDEEETAEEIKTEEAKSVKELEKPAEKAPVKVEKNAEKKAAPKSAEKIPSAPKVELKKAEEPKNETAAPSAPASPKANSHAAKFSTSVPENENPAFILTEDDLDEFGNPDGEEMEYDSPVSVDSVFKKNVLTDPDYNFLYGDGKGTDFIPSDTEEEFDEEEPKSSKASSRRNSYGFNVSAPRKPDPDDDSNEFYMENDDEFDPAASEGTPTGTVSSFGITSKAPSDRRWKVKKSKSLTDEFDAVKADVDE